MAGGGALGGGKAPRRGKKGKRKSKKRLGFHLDMTPLVDITFLLLTFFMLTTSMITPQTMEMNVPPELDVPIEVKQSELLTIRVRDDGTIFYNMGMDAPEKIALKNLRKLVVDQNVQLKNRCIVVLKSSGDAPYGMVVSILDELNVAEPDILAGLKAAGINERKRKFTVAPMEGKDYEEIKGL
ncbi:MAG: biopolymer transporter ExbD [Candidatus Kapabacteria bacterium]|nr:biopolymer transporter ExbD [Candidatus Kapabacteria bacterium]